MPLWAWVVLAIVGFLVVAPIGLLWLPPLARGIRRGLVLEYRSPILWRGQWVTERVITVIEGHWLPRLWRTGGLSLWKGTILLKHYGQGVLVKGLPAKLAPAELVAHEIVHCEQKRVEGGLHYLVGSAWDTVTIRPKRNRPREKSAYAAEQAIVAGTYGPFTVRGLGRYPPLGKMTNDRT